LWTFGTPLSEYAKQFEKMMVEFCKNIDNKEQLETELTTGKVGVLFDKAEGDRYWIIEDGTLWMGTKPNQFGNYLSYFDADRLSKQLGKGDAMPLNSRKNLKAANEKITKYLNDTSKIFGQTLTWVDNAQEIFDGLKAAKKNRGLFVCFWRSAR